MSTEIKEHLSQKDSILRKIISEIAYPEINVTTTVFHDLMSLVIEQQIHYRSTKKIFQKMLDLASIEELTLDNFHLLEEHSFENAKLSTKKFETMNSVIELFSTECIDWKTLSNQEVHSKLKVIKGIGPKTIDSLLIYSLQRDDVFIYDDYHIHKIVSELYGDEFSTPRKLKELSKDWSPYKSNAFRYLLSWKDSLKLKKR